VKPFYFDGCVIAPDHVEISVAPNRGAQGGSRIVKLNDFGKELRKLRIDKSELLKDMAARLGVSPAFISAIETSRKSIPAGFVDRIGAAYDLGDEAKDRFQQAADATRTTFEIRLGDSSSRHERETAALLARQFPNLNLSDSDLDQLLEILNKGRRK
jgi:transcriptional regulator with XRE-family HTH domain